MPFTVSALHHPAHTSGRVLDLPSPRAVPRLKPGVSGVTPYRPSSPLCRARTSSCSPKPGRLPFPICHLPPGVICVPVKPIRLWPRSASNESISACLSTSSPTLDQANQRPALVPLPDGWARPETCSRTPREGRRPNAERPSWLSPSQCSATRLQFSDQSHPSFS